MKKLLLITACISIFTTSCQTTYQVNLSENHPDKSNLIVRLSSPMQNVSVYVDEVRFVERNVKKVTVYGLDPGEYQVKVLAESGNRIRPIEEETSVSLSSGEAYELVYNAPPLTTGHYMQMVLITVGTVAVLAATGFYDNPNEK